MLASIDKNIVHFQMLMRQTAYVIFISQCNDISRATLYNICKQHVAQMNTTISVVYEHYLSRETLRTIIKYEISLHPIRMATVHKKYKN